MSGYANDRRAFDLEEFLNGLKNIKNFKLSDFDLLKAAFRDRHYR